MQSEPQPDITDPEYPTWYYKQCYGVEPDTEDNNYKQWAKQLMESNKSANNLADKGGKSKKDGEEGEGPAAKKKKPEPSETLLEENTL